MGICNFFSNKKHYVFLSSVVLFSQVKADQTLAEAKGCLACHSARSALVGPAFVDIANRYRGAQQDRGRLRQVLREGGVGQWGTLPMPDTPGLTEQEIDILIDWIFNKIK